jgi:excisionase family DNA binding protein
METYLTAKEVAEKVKLSEITIRRYTMLGQIPFHRIVRAVRYKPSEIEKWIEENRDSLTEEQNKASDTDLAADSGETTEGAT